MFEGFEEEIISGDGADIFVRHSGSSDLPPLLLLHGYPQTSAMWHLVAPRLVKNFHVICADLRGYGRSSKPPSDSSHFVYSKRAMASDMVRVMESLGHGRYYVCGHDRGARVSHRMALDHPDRIISLCLLDIAPTREMYGNVTREFVLSYWHWFFLVQRHPLPENIIGADPRGFWKSKCLGMTGGLNPFAPSALEEYLECFDDSSCIHATCEDYRVALTIDIEHDDADNSKKFEQPTLILWSRGGVIDRCFDPLSLWRERGECIEGESVDASHYMAEEIPDEIISHLFNFFISD